MPTITVQLLEGRTLEQKRHFVKAITDAAAKTLDCNPGSIHVIIHEIRKEDWATGGKLWSD
ncbi:4-oxalocrotonate tautomerase [Oxalobacter vibrioformis]|uniref:Tautomerase n=2 Tax=Oxalobacter vibrioformis TaxID=933080 RepID=A0A9E9LXT3_9BURK|nr:4-oxalocrotonate tautomerase [Oxalobacter vibrioformis]